MRITQVHIKGIYKNLSDFKINFDGNSFIEVFVGKNGTGKSNLFEAVIEIFRHLFEKDYLARFDYTIDYELEGKSYEINWEKEKLYLDKTEVKSISKNILPDNILIYYSGHNPKVTELVKEYEDNFKRGLKEANEGDTREFIGIAKDYKSLLLAVLLLQPKENHAREFIKNKLGISRIKQELRIDLKRPYYAMKKGYEIDPEVKETAFWKATGITGRFLKVLDSVKRRESKVIRNEGYFRPENEFEDHYIFYFDLSSFRETFSQLTPQQLFRELDNLKTIEMLQNISIEVELTDGTLGTINQFSDGQFQAVYIYSIIELFKDRNCLMLLDEPDSFLHPEWQYQFLSQIFKITDSAAKNTHVLMTSHSAITLLNSEEKKINLFDFKDNKVNVYKVEKPYAISQLSSKLVRVHQDKQILSVIHTIGQNRPILFSEGYSDPVILHEAWNKLYDTEIPFEICFGHGCHYLRLLLQSEKFLDEMGEFPIFGLFDFDLSYNEWNSIKGEDALVESDPYKGLIKKVRGRHAYAILVPIPTIPEIEKQVIYKDKETYKENSKLEIEHLFYNKATEKHFHKVKAPGGGEIIEFNDSGKMSFASDIVPTVDDYHFKAFKPIIDFILSLCK
jgi:predicted ATPase